jgi:hypothetical protein
MQKELAHITESWVSEQKERVSLAEGAGTLQREYRCRLGTESCQLRITLIHIGVTMYGSNFFNVKYLEK